MACILMLRNVTFAVVPTVLLAEDVSVAVAPLLCRVMGYVHLHTKCMPWRIGQLNTVDTVWIHTLLLVLVAASISELTFALSMFVTVMTGWLFLGGAVLSAHSGWQCLCNKPWFSVFLSHRKGGGA